MKKQHTFEFSQKVAKPTARTTIGFRVDEELFAKLTRRAKALGVSPHELARHYVMELLSAEEERTALRETVNPKNRTTDQSIIATEIPQSDAATRKSRSAVKSSLVSHPIRYP